MVTEQPHLRGGAWSVSASSRSYFEQNSEYCLKVKIGRHFSHHVSPNFTL